MERSLEEQRQTVAHNLSVALAERGKTQSDLAVFCKVGKSTVSNWCTGLKKPKTETLASIARWLDVPIEYLIGSGMFEDWKSINADRLGVLDSFPEWCDDQMCSVIYNISRTCPKVSDEVDFANFINEQVSSIKHRIDGSWDIKLRSPTGNGPHTKITDDQIKAAFFNGADPTLTKEEQDAMWDEAKAFIDFKIQQRKRKENQ